MKTKQFIHLISLCVLITLNISCKKDWLEAKPSDRLVVPTSIADARALLDDGNMNAYMPVLGEISADNYYMTYSTFQDRYIVEKNSYIWAPDVLTGEPLSDWDFSYTQIHTANLALETLENAPKTPDNETEWSIVKGSAFFYRAFAYFNLASLVAKPYDQSTADTDPGVPIRLTTEINTKIGRATIQQTYDRILADLKESIPLLPDHNLIHALFRPDKHSAYTMLSRVYLAMGDYPNSLIYSDSSLQVDNSLLDFNSITDLDGSISFPNPEIVYNVYLTFSVSLYFGLVDTTLYSFYGTNDLRKTVFFRNTGGNISFKGSYSGNVLLFGGLANDEIYLNKAECLARSGNIIEAMNTLNALLVKRWTAGTFVTYVATTVNDALIQILQERRKELLFRNLRWIDLRRLNKDPIFATTLMRVLNGQTYTLSPNSDLYVFPIPNNEILYNNIAQNPR